MKLVLVEVEIGESEGVGNSEIVDDNVVGNREIVGRDEVWLVPVESSACGSGRSV